MTQTNRTKELIADYEEMPRSGPVYLEGKRAFHSGLHVDGCPYRIGHQSRQIWMTGWFDERTRSRLGEVFARWRLEWP